MTNTCASVCRGWRSSALLLAAVAAAALRADQAAPPIQLPPFLVETSNAPVWLHGSEPGFEVLSRCSEDTTRQVLRSVWHARAEFDAVLAGHFRATRSLPVLLIVYPQEWKPSMPPGIEQALHVPAHAFGGPFGPRVSFLPNIAFGLSEQPIVFFIAPDNLGQGFNGFTVVAAEEELYDRIPPLPPWFCAGFAQYYGRIRWVQHIWHVSTSSMFPVFTPGSAPTDDDRSIELAEGTTEWTSARETRLLRHEADAPRWLLPLGELLADRQPTDPERSQVWRAESELLIRWLESRGPSGQETLWRLADAQSKGPLTESAFQQIVGMNFSDAFDALSDYLPDALSDEAPPSHFQLPDPPEPRLREARSSEITELKAVWEEAEVEFIKDRYPTLLPAYVAQAQATLDRSPRYGPETPQTLALRGLLALDQGQRAAARGYLEAAAAGGVVRPSIYLKLAALRLEDAQAHPLGAGGKISRGQARSVLDPLWASRDQTPLAVPCFLLAAKTALICEGDPGGHFAAYLDLGRTLYPNDRALAAIPASKLAPDASDAAP